jgi:hypothetical protein
MNTIELLSLSIQGASVRFYVPPTYRAHLVPLPWQCPLETWDQQGVKFIAVKSGLSRHVVRFIASEQRRFAIKETTRESAHRELASYMRLAQRNIPTLIPVGIVTRYDGSEIVETKVGEQIQERETGYLVTELMEKVIPDSFLFKRGFTKANRNRIWEAVIKLFVQMHSQGVYWGDASLANMLIKFHSEIVPELGHRTVLNAVLADAETVEIHSTISDSLRLADVEFFLESMLWTEADLKASGIVCDPLIRKEDQQYILDSYNERFAVEQEIRSFELVTHIDVDKLLGNFDAKGHGKLLLQHINEHKWYLSEKRKMEIPLIEAAEDWYREIFKPVCKSFNQYGLLEFFPNKTASSLYVEVMEHKYFMSQRKKEDVGLLVALQDYCSRTTKQEPLRVTLGSIVEALTLLFRGQSPATSKIYLL